MCCTQLGTSHPPQKVREELQRMQAMGAISKVDKPTEWCAGMVVAPKKSGGVCICVDSKPLNDSVLCETHPLSKVDETLAQMSQAAVFSKLDANSRFGRYPWPKHLVTSLPSSPPGCYCFNKLLYGISSAPEYFQKRMSTIFSGLEGVSSWMMSWFGQFPVRTR